MGFRENGCGRLIRVKGTDWSGHLDWPVNESRQAVPLGGECLLAFGRRRDDAFYSQVGDQIAVV